jgi:dTDP-4-dehydrorhamnose reductase
MRVLVYGSKGWIGQMFIKLLDMEQINYNHGVARVNIEEDVNNEISNLKPTHIVSFIGRTHGENYSTIDYLEQPGKLYENIRDNMYGPFVLALLAERHKIHYTYLGTGCIFKYDDNHPYGKEMNGFTETDEPNFFGSAYSIVKGFTDMMMKKYNVLNLRIRMPITDIDNPRNFITKITTYKKICSIPNSMTVLPDLLPIMLDMMKQNLTGTFNFTNPGLISHNEILEMYKEYVDNTFTWENFTEEEQRQILKADRSNNYMDTIKLESYYPNILDIKESVKRCLMRFVK